MKVVSTILASLLAAAFAYTPCDLQAEFDTVMCKSAACTNCDMEWCIDKCVAWQEKYNRCRCRNWPCSRRCYNVKACPNEADAVPCTDPTLPPTEPPPGAKELEGGPEKELEGDPEKELEKEVEGEEEPPKKEEPKKEEAKKEEPKKAPEKEKWVDPWAHEGGDELEGEMMDEPEGGWPEDDYDYDDYGDDDYGGGLDLHGRKVNHTGLHHTNHSKGHHHKGHHHKGHHGHHHQGQPKAQPVSGKAFLSSHLEA